MIRNAYRWVCDHLTKWLGALGFLLMQLDPDSLHTAAVSYLDDHTVRVIGKVLFGLVIARGWYTGWKAKQTDALPPPVTR